MYLRGCGKASQRLTVVFFSVLVQVCGTDGRCVARVSPATLTQAHLRHTAGGAQRQLSGVGGGPTVVFQGLVGSSGSSHVSRLCCGTREWLWRPSGKLCRVPVL